MSTVEPRPSSAGRALALLLVGLFMGAMVTLVAMQSLQRKAGYSDGLMAVLQHHLGELRKHARPGSCQPAAATNAHARLALLATDIPASLADRGALVQGMTDDLRTALGDGTAVCTDLPKRLAAVDASCKACHSQLR